MSKANLFVLCHGEEKLHESEHFSDLALFGQLKNTNSLSQQLYVFALR